MRRLAAAGWPRGRWAGLLREMITTVKRAVGRAEVIAHYFAATGKAQTMLGFCPMTGFEDDMRRPAEYLASL